MKMKEQARLTKETIEYLHILHTIHTTTKYYSDLFGIDPWENPTQIPVDMLERDGRTILRFKFLAYATLNSQNYSAREIKEIMQQYLDYCILPNDKILRPYIGGSSIYDLVEPLYIDKIGKDGNMWQIDIIFIDNPIAFEHVKKAKGLKGGI